MTRRLVLNAGSSSLKVALFDQGAVEVGRGALTGLGHEPAFEFQWAGSEETLRHSFDATALHMDEALDFVFAELGRAGALDGLGAIGHRIVHGGRKLTAPTLLDDAVLTYLRSLAPLAPLHQPYNLAIVDAARSRFKDLPQVGAFDTAFHATRPPLQRLYGLPRAILEAGVESYGFHGLSFDAIAGRLRTRFGEAAGGRVIVLHLGGGSSLCALAEGRSMATTMGFSPLDGPVMATRCGAIDPGVILHLIRRQGMDAAAVEDMLYRQAGLAGLSGLTGDMRELVASDAPQAQEALDYFVLTVCRQIGALVATLGGVDRLVFTAGIGENAPEVRARIAGKLGWLGIELDPAANRAGLEDIGHRDGVPALHVLRTDEERVVAEGMDACLA